MTRKIKSYLRVQYQKLFPKHRASKLYRLYFHRPLNWIHPTDLNEKIRWIQFNTDTRKWSLLADKLRVRDYLKRNGYEKNLVKLYGYWEKAEDIDFSRLPEKFVLKTNHGYGNVYVIKDKNKENLEVIRGQLGKAIKQPFGYFTAEPHYTKIKPYILAEELLEQDGGISSSLIDYKFYCIDGVPQYCLVVYNREYNSLNHHVKLYDMMWQDCSHLLKKYIPRSDLQFPKPKTLTEMIAFCNAMCSDFPFVRMDFYEVSGKMYFGEFTFTPAACTGGSLGEELCLQLGKLIKLPH